METGSILDHKRSGRPSIDEETVDAMHVAFHRTPGNQSVLNQINLQSLEKQFIKFYINDFRSMFTNYKLFKFLSRMIALAEEIFQRIDK